MNRKRIEQIVDDAFEERWSEVIRTETLWDSPASQINDQGNSSLRLIGMNKVKVSLIR